MIFDILGVVLPISCLALVSPCLALVSPLSRPCLALSRPVFLFFPSFGLCSSLICPLHPRFQSESTFCQRPLPDQPAQLICRPEFSRSSQLCLHAGAGMAIASECAAARRFSRGIRRMPRKKRRAVAHSRCNRHSPGRGAFSRLGRLCRSPLRL